MSKDRVDLDAETVAGDAGDGSPELFKRQIAGLDKKVTALAEENKRLADELARAKSEAGGRTAEQIDEATKLAALAERVRIREKDLDSQAAAVNEAIERGLPISLMLKGREDLADTVAELESFRRKVEQAATGRVGTAAGAPGHYGDKRPRLTADHLKKMGPAELRRIPDRIFDALAFGASDGKN